MTRKLLCISIPFESLGISADMPDEEISSVIETMPMFTMYREMGAKIFMSKEGN